MQEDTPKVNVKCPECKGSGRLMKLWPLYAISMPHELAWQLKPCWRCKGTGDLQADDPYVGVVMPKALAVTVWFLSYAVAALVVIAILLV